MAFSDDLKRSIQISQSLAKENSNGNFAPAHLLRALLHNEIGLATLLAAMDKDVHYVRDWADIRIESLPKIGRAHV